MYHTTHSCKLTHSSAHVDRGILCCHLFVAHISSSVQFTSPNSIRERGPGELVDNFRLLFINKKCKTIKIKINFSVFFLVFIFIGSLTEINRNVVPCTSIGSIHYLGCKLFHKSRLHCCCWPFIPKEEKNNRQNHNLW